MLVVVLPYLVLLNIVYVFAYFNVRFSIWKQRNALECMKTLEIHVEIKRFTSKRITVCMNGEVGRLAL